VSFASTGELLTFEATFEQHCEGFDPALFGRIRIEIPRRLQMSRHPS
jgi:hypothetical protein